MVWEEKLFRRLEQFEGKEEKWQEWIFNLLVAVGQVSAECVWWEWKVMSEGLVVLEPEGLKFKVGEQVRRSLGVSCLEFCVR